MNHGRNSVNRICLLSVLLLTIVAGLAGAQGKSTQQARAQELPYLFKRGEEGYHTFRIPAIVATQTGSLLAFSEGRKGGDRDTGDIDLVMKRSEDGGETWSALQVIWNDAENTCGNPAPVVDRATGTILLLATWNLGTDTEAEIIAQTSQDTRRVFVLRSNSDGRKWSRPEEITEAVKLPEWTWYATGPGSGIQIREGAFADRLVIACDHIEAKSKKYYSHTIYSDDGGATWQRGGTTPTDQVNECEVVELSDQRLMLNMRNYDRSSRTRQLAYSQDGGLRWAGMHHHETLVEPICQASMVRYDTLGKTYLLFANPASQEKRENMTLRLSQDDGQTWPIAHIIHPGPSAYSDLVALPDQRAIGILYEGGQERAYDGIVWETVPLDQLLGAE